MVLEEIKNIESLATTPTSEQRWTMDNGQILTKNLTLAYRSGEIKAR